jgi:hypothetical protein
VIHETVTDSHTHTHTHTHTNTHNKQSAHAYLTAALLRMLLLSAWYSRICTSSCLLFSLRPAEAEAFTLPIFFGDRILDALSEALLKKSFSLVSWVSFASFCAGVGVGGDTLPS